MGNDRASIERNIVGLNSLEDGLTLVKIPFFCFLRKDVLILHKTNVTKHKTISTKIYASQTNIFNHKFLETTQHSSYICMFFLSF